MESLVNLSVTLKESQEVSNDKDDEIVDSTDTTGIFSDLSIGIQDENFQIMKRGSSIPQPLNDIRTKKSDSQISPTNRISTSEPNHGEASGAAAPQDRGKDRESTNQSIER